MPYFTNCSQNGIVAHNGSQIRVTQPMYFNNISNVAVSLNSSSQLRADGISSISGSSISMNQVYTGIRMANASAEVSNAKIESCQFGVISTKNSSFTFDDSYIVGKANYTVPSYGIYNDGNSVGTAYGTIVSSFITGSTSGTGAMYKNVNGSILFVLDAASASAANTTGLFTSYVVADPTRGNYANVSDVNQEEVPFPPD